MRRVPSTRQGWSWAGSDCFKSEALELFDRKNGVFEAISHGTKVEAYRILSLFEDSSGRLWFGSNEGLSLVDPDTKQSRLIKNGLVGNPVQSIVEDKDGNLWLGTNNGVSFYSPLTKHVRHYTRNSGKLIGSINIGAAKVSSQQEIIFGGVNGLRIFKPDELKTNTTPPPVS